MQKLDLNILERSISQVFEERAICDGERLAIQFQNRSVTYNELNAWANRIARAIIEKRGVGAEPIALLFETGPEIVAAMLGVLKAGKFYIPLDISWPQARLNSIFEDSQTELILSDRRQFQATELGDRDVLWLDTLQPGISEENLKIQSSPDDLAYIIYTSGSSGKPKGVMQNHRYALNLYYTYSNIGEITKSDRFSLLYSVGFTGAVRDIYCSLLNGAALFPLDVKEIGLHQLGQWLEDNEITVMFAVATLFRHFAATLKGQGHFPKLRLIQIGSETVYRQDAELFEEHFSDRCRLIVFLGSTEISPVRQFSITKDTAIEGSTVPVGYGIEGTEVLLWDELGREVPTGEVGEIVVSSRQLALGYWRKPEVTEQVFVKKSDRRYFKTGDLGRFLPDGCLLHLGRKDFQVKIRGYRLETSEVEEALLSLESVKEAVVVATTDEGGAPGDRLLVAYLTAFNSDNKATVQELKEAVAERLPDYAIPACFIWLESLPLTATGKIDRRSLPKPEISSSSDLEIVPPRNATEERLVQIWSEVLNLEAIGVENNFFELGGNSLHASRVLARISDKFNRELSLKTIFAEATIAQLAKHLDSAKAKTSLPALVPTPTLRETKIPLSLAQQRLWFLDRLESNKAIYNLFRGFRLRGAIDVSSLEKAIQAIIERHEILRTTLEVVDGVPVQAIAPSLPFSLEISDLQDLPSTERQTKVEEITKEIQGWIFDLARPPLLKIVLIRLSDGESKLLITMHHIISDDWSIQVFLKELSLLYKAFHQNSASPLRPLPVQYGDYTHWQLQYLAGEILEEQLDYWRSQLAGAPPLLDLPTDFPRSHSDAGFQSGIVPMKIDGETTEKLKALSRRSQTTLFVTILTAFAVLLSRYSNQEDLVVGTAIANRNPAITEQLIGFFVSTLALRIQLPDNPTFLSLLDRVGQTAIEAHAHADVHFDRLVEALQIQRHPNYSPIFQVMFILQNVTQETLAFPELETERLDFLKPTAGATFDLTLSLTENNDGLVGTLEYNASLFARASIERMAGHFQRLIAAIAESPEMAIAQFPLLSAQEREQLLIEWNRTETDYPRHSCVHQLFETQVENTPEAIALVFGEQTLTYTELNEKANQLARYLQAQGVGVESLVGVCLERSPNLIVALLAILKAGGAYLPLDPTYPRDRLAFMVENADIQVIVSETGLSENLLQVANSVNLNTQAKTIAAYPKENLNASATTESLAYVMYTSGSTGQPKGVSVTHRNIVRLANNTNYVKLRPSDRIGQASNVAFDAATFEIWGALLNGGQLIGIPKDTLLSASDLHKHLRQHGITTLFLTTALFNQLINELPDILACLKTVLFGGEVVDTTVVRAALTADRPNKLLHVYGPTENTTFSLWYPIETVPLEATTIPIGRPIANTRAYILDSQQQPVPIGVAGELYVGGDGVARGYLNRPELNAERFIPSPFVEGDRLYKTGDKARYLPDGNIEFLGRADRQVKIRGFRIEIGEIEAVLSQHPEVKQAVVIVHENSLGDKSLVAYAIGPKERVSNAELRLFLQQKLPHYMLPSVFVILDELPLTPNGKVDRRALPAPERELSGLNVELVAPRTPTEVKLVAIWLEVLERQQVGINDNFFELGGHSLLASQIVSRLWQTFSVEVPLRKLFAAPTIASLGKMIDMANQLKYQASPESSEKLNKFVPLSPVSRDTKIPMSFAQEYIWSVQQSNPDPCVCNSGVALRLAGTLSSEVLTRSINKIIQRHEILRTTFPLVDGQPVQAIAPELKLSLKIVNLQDIPPTEREVEALKISQREMKQPFDLTSGPLIKIVLLQLSLEEDWLLIPMHHIITDGRSIGIFLQELEMLYLAFSRDLPSSLPEVPLQYADFTLWQQQRFSEGEWQKQHDYWLQKLVGTQQALKELSGRESKSNLISCRASSYSLVLKKNLVASLKNLSCSQNVTISTIILAALKILLFKWSGQREILVVATIGNRSTPEIEKILGCFINDVILRSELDEQITGLELLEQVKETLDEAIINREIPFHKVIKSVKSKRKLMLSASVTIEPPIKGFELMAGRKVAPYPTKRQLWDEEIPLEIYISSFSEDSKTIKIQAIYSTDLFSGETVKNMFKNYRKILHNLADSPERKIGTW